MSKGQNFKIKVIDVAKQQEMQPMKFQEWKNYNTSNKRDDTKPFKSWSFNVKVRTENYLIYFMFIYWAFVEEGLQEMLKL